ncbi:hypothetical protein [Streptomyces sp. NPDC005486]|uniref:hypothetical protein n=1 Tax=Streptomyces sp. NPDC005486 TaxID=3155345 RepID=UPI00339F63AF
MTARPVPIRPACLRDDARARHDGSAETDTDVLPRRHQLGYRTALLGLREYALVPNPSAGAEYERPTGRPAACSDRRGRS